MSARMIHAHDALAALREMSTASVEAVITDPPYSSGGMFRADRIGNVDEKYTSSEFRGRFPDFDGDSRDQRSYGYWCALWLSECLRIAVPGSPICVFTDWRQLPTTTDAVQAGGWVWRGIVPWNKTEATRPQMGRFRAQAEYIVWGSSGALATRENVGVLPGAFEVPVRPDDKFHVTGKPTALMRQIVRICEPGGVILDPFAGSGTTGVAAVSAGYSFIGIERSAAYVEIAERRLAEAQGQSHPSIEQLTLGGAA